MKRLLSSKKMYRLSYLVGLILLLVGMFLSIASVPAQANFAPVEAGKKATTTAKTKAKAARAKKAKKANLKLLQETETASPTEMGSETPAPSKTPAPSEVPPVVTAMVAFTQADTAVCQMDAGPLSASVSVTLGAGQTAILQTAWKVAEPADLRTSEVYSEQTVSNGDTVTATGQWPGVRMTDQVVEIHLGAILLDPVTKNPISAGTGMDYYWYPWFCPVAAPATETAVPTAAPSEVPTEAPTAVMTEVPTTAATEVPTLVPTVPLPTIGATEVATETMAPTEVPTEASTETMVPTEAPTETMVPTEAPTEAATETTVPTEVPTGAPTVAPSETMAPTLVPVGGGAVFQQLDTAVCQMTAGPMSAQVTVTLPSGVTNAVLETAWKVAEPMDLRTSDQYTFTPVTKGQVVTVTGQWPGVRATDQVVEIHLGAILLDAATMNPIDGASVGSLDFYWYPWFCPFAGGPTEVPTSEMTETPTSVVPTEVLPTEVLPTEVSPTEGPTEVSPTEVPTEEATPTVVPVTLPMVGFTTESTPLCQMTAGPITAQVMVTLPEGMTAILQTAWKVAEPADLRTNETYNEVTVMNGDVVTTTAQWPGVRATDQNVEVHFGAILLDADTMAPISSGTGVDTFWGTSVCAVAGPTAAPTTMAAASAPVTRSLAVSSASQPAAQTAANPSLAEVLSNWWHNLLVRMGWSG